MAWDDSGSLLVNTCYFIPGAEKWILACLLSKVTLFYVQKVLGSDEGGFIRLFTIHVEKFPLPKATPARKAQLIILADYLLWLYSNDRNKRLDQQNSRQSLMTSYFEQLLNGLVYELFFPDELHAHKLFLFDYTEKAKLPALDMLPKAKRTAALQEAFKRIYDQNHPIRGCLFSLSSLPTVRLIEGEHEEAASILPPVMETDQDHGRQALRETA
jgi:hypothetical protein